MSGRRFKAFLDKRTGGFLAIPLDGKSRFGCMVQNGYLACYDIVSDAALPVSTIASAPTLFTVVVDYGEFVTGRWKVIGHEPLEEHLIRPRKFYREDPITKKIDVYFDGKFFPVTDEGVSKQECATAWSADNVEARLRKHFAG